MEDKDHVTLGDTIKHFIYSLGGLFTDLVRLALTEAQLAGRSVVSLIFLFLFLGAMLLTTLIYLQAALVVFLVSLQFSWLTSLLIVSLLNSVILACTWIVIHKTKQNLYFHATRRQLSGLKDLTKI